MNVELPDTGCNVLQSNNLLYNYSSNNRVLREYVIYDGQIRLRRETTSNYTYDHNGDCLVTGDLVYRPELKGVWFPIVGLIVILFIYRLVFRLFRGRL